MIKLKNKQIAKSGLLISTGLVVGNMIGSGIFLLPSSLAVFGGISVFGWLFTTIGAIFLALVFSRLSKVIKKPGGPYAYSKSAFGKFAGFLVAWGYWISIWVGNAAIAVAGVGYLSVFFPILSQNNTIAGITAISMIILLSLVNSTSFKNVGYVQVITTFLKIAPLILIGTVGFYYFNADHFTPLNLSKLSNFDAITASAALTLWAFLGLESATIPYNNIKNPKKTIPLATILGTLIAAVIYISSFIAIMGIINPQDLAKSVAPYADSARIILGKSGAMLIAAGAAISCFGALNGWILLQGQIPYAAANDDVFPQVFKRTNVRGIPILGIFISSLMACIIVGMNFTKGLSDMFSFMIKLSTLTVLVPYLLSSLSELIIELRKKGDFNRKKIIIILSISVPAFLYSLWAVVGLGSEIIYLGLLLLGGGIPFYFMIKHSHKKETAIDK